MSTGRKPIITIAIPVYNGESLLAPMLGALEGQDWDHFEVRFGDDGSTDGTRRVLDRFAARHPGSVFVESHENMGEGPTRNRLVTQAGGEYVWFCDADDEIAPGSIARIAGILRDAPVDFLSFCYGARPDDPAKAKLGLSPVPVTPLELMLSMPCATTAKVLKTAMLRDNGVEFPATKVGDDIVQSIHSACVSKSALFWYAKPYWVRRRPDSASGAVDGNFCAELWRSLDLANGMAAKFPAFRNAIQLQMLDYWNYFLRRLREDADQDIRRKWSPEVEKAMAELATSEDNPLLRIPRAFCRREREALTRERSSSIAAASAMRREQAALKREKAALRREQALRSSLSWRITAPLRFLLRAIRPHGWK